jgi:hypothetical protein
VALQSAKVAHFCEDFTTDFKMKSPPSQSIPDPCNPRNPWFTSFWLRLAAPGLFAANGSSLF